MAAYFEEVIISVRSGDANVCDSAVLLRASFSCHHINGRTKRRVRGRGWGLAGGMVKRRVLEREAGYGAGREGYGGLEEGGVASSGHRLDEGEREERVWEEVLEGRTRGGVREGG